MQSLKKKFGKFAVSNDKMAMVSGGSTGCPEHWECVDDAGHTLSTPGRSSMSNFMQNYESTGATCVNTVATITTISGVIECE